MVAVFSLGSLCEEALHFLNASFPPVLFHMYIQVLHYVLCSLAIIQLPKTLYWLLSMQCSVLIEENCYIVVQFICD